MRVALVTWSGLPDLAEDDRLLEGEAVSWDDPTVAWESFDAVILRSTWDYHTRIEEFTAWLDHLETVSARVWNPVPLVRRNIHKGYLLDLAAAGVPVVATTLVRAGDSVTLTERSVVKPAVSASGYLTRVVDAGQSLHADRDLLIQPFIEEIVTRGEWSFIFFAGRYSHAVLKRAAPGDFRVQNNFGGTAHAAHPPASLIVQAHAIVATIEGPWLYARVDAVETPAHHLLLMELELTEPSLFLTEDSARTLGSELRFSV